jgi:undecaprenyl-diphosphatase
VDWILLGGPDPGVVEGLTEFLPIRHRPSDLGGRPADFNDEKGKIFEIVIQCGAILAVCREYRASLVGAEEPRRAAEACPRFAMNPLVAFPVAARVVVRSRSRPHCSNPCR